MTIDAFHHGEGHARAGRELAGGPFEHPWTEAEQRRTSRRKKAWAPILAWLWPGTLGDGMLGGRTPGAAEASRTRQALWSRRRRRVTLAAILLATAAATPGFMGGAVGLPKAGADLFQGRAAANAGAGAGAPAGAYAQGRAGHLIGVDAQTHEQQGHKIEDQASGGSGQGDNSQSTPAGGDGSGPGLTFLGVDAAGSSAGGGFGFGHSGGSGGSGGGGGGGGSGGGGGTPPGQPLDPSDSGDNPQAADPLDPTGGEDPAGNGPPELDDPPINDGIGPKTPIDDDFEVPSGGDLPGQPQTPTSAAPEPQAWFLMIVGFGAVGWALRRRRQIRFAA